MSAVKPTAKQLQGVRTEAQKLVQAKSVEASSKEQYEAAKKSVIDQQAYLDSLKKAFGVSDQDLEPSPTANPASSVRNAGAPRSTTSANA